MCAWTRPEIQLRADFASTRSDNAERQWNERQRRKQHHGTAARSPSQLVIAYHKQRRQCWRPL